MFLRRCRCLRSPSLPCLYLGCGFVFFWLILLVSNSVSRGRTEQRFQQRHEPIIESRRDRHSRALYAEIKKIIAQPVLNWTAFLHGPLRANFKSAPSGCGEDEASHLPACDATPRMLGDLSEQVSKVEAIRLQNPHKIPASSSVLPGGAFRPPCRSTQRVAIVIPFRDRWSQLKTLLGVLHSMLQRQQLCYRIFVAEQYGCQAFNKGRLNNAAFLEASKRFRFDCVIFQDADIVPLNDRNSYGCPGARPRHMAVAVDVHKFRLPYSALVGGVIAFRTEHYVKVNGYSNLYWGWGLEDDDMEIRMKTATKLRYVRPSQQVARYKALSHRPQRIYSLQGARRKPLLSTLMRRYAKDGLNSIKYDVIAARNEPAYTHLLLDIGQQPADFNDE